MIYRIDELIQRSWVKMHGEDFDDLEAAKARAQKLTEERFYPHVVVMNKKNRHIQRFDVKESPITGAFSVNESMTLSERLDASRKVEHAEAAKKKELYNERKRLQWLRDTGKRITKRSSYFQFKCVHCGKEWASKHQRPGRCPNMECRATLWWDPDHTGYEKVESRILTCKVCGYQWKTRVLRPLNCPNKKCYSAYWDQSDVFVDKQSAPCENAASSGIKDTNAVDPIT